MADFQRMLTRYQVACAGAEGALIKFQLARSDTASSRWESKHKQWCAERDAIRAQLIEKYHLATAQ